MWDDGECDISDREVSELGFSICRCLWVWSDADEKVAEQPKRKD
jgi:hypothetical protein